jgi:hypothetical protein
MVGDIEIFCVEVMENNYRRIFVFIYCLRMICLKKKWQKNDR